jgi:hypothetical protein
LWSFYFLEGKLEFSLYSLPLYSILYLLILPDTVDSAILQSILLLSSYCSYCGREIGVTPAPDSEVGHPGEYSSAPESREHLFSTPWTEKGSIIVDSFNSYRTFGIVCVFVSILVSIYYHSSGLFSSECRAYPQLFYRSSHWERSQPFCCFPTCPAVAAHYRYSVHPSFPAHYYRDTQKVSVDCSNNCSNSVIVYLFTDILLLVELLL